MKAAIRDQWIKDLRSGEYEQGNGVLDRLEDGKRTFCCLGVLCRQAVKAGVIPEPELKRVTHYYLDDDEMRGGEGFVEYASLPRKVREWAGVDRSDIQIGVGITAIGANDSLKWSFAEIADAIERNVPRDA